MDHSTIKRIIDNALGRIRRPFRGIIHRVDGNPDNQLLQIEGLAAESLSQTEMAQQFGLTSHPPTGSQCIVLPLGGSTQHGVVIATENGQHRVRSLAEGEVVLYNAHGDSVRLRENGLIEINCRNLVINASEGVQINTPQISTTANVQIDGSAHSNGDLVADGNVADAGGSKTMSGMRDTFNGHSKHPPVPRM